MPGIQVKLESAHPAPMTVGTGGAVLVYGSCSHPVREIAVEGQGRHPVAACVMPRFWAAVPIEQQPRPAKVEISVVARGGRDAEELALLTEIEWIQEPASRAPARALTDGTIAVCMATYEPDLDLFGAQVDSLRAQTDTGWTCFVSDDASSDERFDAMRALLHDDPRFEVSRAVRRLGFYRNFERAIRMTPPDAELLALCDQDDRWHPNKLETLRRALGGALLVYSDLRLVDERGAVLRETMWRGRANNHTDLAALLTANTITGAATLFRRELVEIALPFPDLPGIQFHDHWLGCAALAAGEVAYVGEPLYDYVQHGSAVFGEVSGGRPARGARSWRGAYFLGYLQRELMARTLLVRCRGRLSERKRRALDRYISAGSSPASLAWLALRPLRALRGRTDTLGSELELVRGILWKHAVVLLARLPGPWSPNVTFPEPLAFEQRRLRRWRSRA